MSQEQAERFLDHVEGDPGLRARLGALRGKDALAQLVAIAREAGFSFTEGEYRGAVVARSEGELSAESLDALIREISPDLE